MARAIVVGGGISGLALGYWLGARSCAQGRPLEVTVLEARSAPGGNVRTIHEDGFLVECGPNGWLDREPKARELLRDLGMADDLIEAEPAAKRRFIVREGRLCQVPEAPPTLLSSDVLSAGGKLRLLMEPFARRAPQGVDETVFEFAERRIGREAAEYLVDAAVSGISAGDSRRLSVRAAFPLMTEMEAEHGSLIRAMIARRKLGPSKLVTLNRGLGSLIERLAERLGSRLRCDSAVALEPKSGVWRVTLENGAALEAERVVLALPAWHAAALVQPLDRAAADELGRIPAAGLAMVALAYRASDVAREVAGYGYLVTRGERADTLGVVWESSLFPGRAPQGMVLLRAMLGGVRHPELAALAPEELEARAVREMTPLLGLRGAPSKRWIVRWPAAIPQYERGHLERVARARAAIARLPGLTLCGTSYDGIAFPAAIASADRIAQELLASESAPAEPAHDDPRYAAAAAGGQ